VRHKDYFFSFTGVRTFLPIAGGMVVATLVLAAAYRGLPRRWEGIRLGATKDRLHYAFPVERLWGPRRVEGEAPWSDVYFDNARLLAGGHLLVLAPPPFGKLFDPQRLRAVIVDRIPPENRVTRGQLTAKALPTLLRNTLPRLVLIVLAIGAAVIALRRLL
jgi:hypothetical protein